MNRSIALMSLLLSLMFIPAALATPPATEPSTRPPTIAEMKEETRREIADWMVLPLTSRRLMSDVMRFGVEKGQLVIDWPICASGPKKSRLAIDEVPGLAIINFQQYRNNRRITPLFELYDLSDPKIVCRHLQVLDSEMSLQVDEEFEYAEDQAVDQFASISLIEPAVHNGEKAITVRIQTPNQKTITFTANTLQSLRAENPAEYEKYLRPMFRAFKQERAGFTVDDNVAWQVMADEWAPPDKTKQHVQSLVDQLKADDFAKRQKAEASLDALGMPEVLDLEMIPKDSLTPEQGARIKKVWAARCPLTPGQRDYFSRDLNFLLDCLNTDDGDLRLATVRRIEHVLGRRIEFNPGAGAMERSRRIEGLRAELCPASTRPSPDVALPKSQP